MVKVLDNRYILRGKSTWTIRRKRVGLSFPLNGHISYICWNAYFWGIPDIFYLCENEVWPLHGVQGFDSKVLMKRDI